MAVALAAHCRPNRNTLPDGQIELAGTLAIKVEAAAYAGITPC